jgi:hypothetical protein
MLWGELIPGVYCCSIEVLCEEKKRKSEDIAIDLFIINLGLS